MTAAQAIVGIMQSLSVGWITALQTHSILQIAQIHVGNFFSIAKEA
jgi:hypothetical protein